MTPVKDFTPTKEQISLHGLGFIQVTLPANKRLHVWHPDLPRRSCYQYSSIHNHRFSFKSTVLVGTQVNQRYHIVMHPEGTHEAISHDGPRSEKGGRLSYPVGRVNIVKKGDVETYTPGSWYIMPPLEYHETPNSGIVVTLMEKLEEGEIHANSIIEHGHTFDQSFDRFQIPADELWQIVVRSMQS